LSDGCSTNEGHKKSYRIFVGEPEWKRPFGRCVYGRIILQFALKKQMCGLDSCGSC